MQKEQEKSLKHLKMKFIRGVLNDIQTKYVAACLKRVDYLIKNLKSEIVSRQEKIKTLQKELEDVNVCIVALLDF